MLWYKFWRETRVRWMMSILALAWVCAVIVVIEKTTRAHAEQPMSYISYIWQAVYKGYVRDIFVLLAIVLGGGSLLQERAHGTVGFTLALPVSRSRLIAMRTAVGLSEILLLALVPAVVVPALSPFFGETYPILQALQFSLLWTVCGALVFGAALLLSTLMAGEYSAWMACFLAMMLYSAIVNVTALQRIPALNFFKIMSGAQMPYFRASEHLLSGPLSWQPLATILLIAAGFLVAAGRLTARQEF
jgi:ABC-type transport system involved in multi-copper enzyme maturation permease subunit